MLIFEEKKNNKKIMAIKIYLHLCVPMVLLYISEHLSVRASDLNVI